MFRLYAILLGFLSLLALNACGGPSEVPAEWNELTEMYGLPSVVATTEAQNEVQSVLEEVNNHMFSAAAQATGTNIGSVAIRGSHNILSVTQTASPTFCKPSITLVAIGIGLKFTPANGCFLEGTISVNILPLRVNVDLKVVGLSFVSSISMSGDISLSAGSTSSMELVIQNGNIGLKLGSLFPNGFTLSGRSKFSFGASGTALSSRTNAFESTSKAGVALVADLKQVNGTWQKKVDSCFLSGGDPMDPEAGDLSFCFGLFK